MDEKPSATTELLNILSRAMDSKMYGSVEVYLEDGQVTQITQRIIKKMKKVKPVIAIKKVPARTSPRKNEGATLKFS